jgi:EmrB/QacA subfamily drug resistance transporter
MMEGTSFEGSGSAVTVAEDPALGLDQRAKFEILAAILLALFLGALDQTIVGTALPRIVTDLGGNDYYTWVVTIYLLTSTITVPFYGKLSDIYGRRPLLMIGVALFLIGSALSGLSQNMFELILFRGVQGLGAGSLFPISLAVIGDLFTPAERGKYQGLFGAVFGISFIVGPALGGFLTDNISWHWIFYVNLPIGLLSLYIIWHLLPTIKRAGASRSFDIAGALVFTVGISFLLVGLTNKLSADWTDFGVGGFIAIGLALSVLFVFIESRTSEAIVPLDLWRSRTYVASVLATFFVSFGFFGSIIFLPRFFQVVRGDSATASGYEIFPLLIGLIGSSIVAGFIVARTGRYKILILSGLTIMAVGIVLMTQLQATTDLPTFWLWMFITGVGIGPTLSVFTIVVQNAVPFNKLGVATSNLTFFRQIGGSVGLAISGTIFGSALADKLPSQLGPVFGQIKAAAPPAFQSQFDNLQGNIAGSLDVNNLTGVGQSFGAAVTDAVVKQAPTQAAAIHQLFDPFKTQLDAAFHQAFALAIGVTFQIGVVACVVAVVVAVFMRDIPLRKSFAPSTAPAAAGAPGAPNTGETTPAADPSPAYNAARQPD